jgi:regulator of replication initiation timing
MTAISPNNVKIYNLDRLPGYQSTGQYLSSLTEQPNAYDQCDYIKSAIEKELIKENHRLWVENSRLRYLLAMEKNQLQNEIQQLQNEIQKLESKLYENNTDDDIEYIPFKPHSRSPVVIKVRNRGKGVFPIILDDEE